MGSVIMKALDKSNKTSFKRRSYTIIARYKLSFIAENDVLDELGPIFMGDFLNVKLHYISSLRLSGKLVRKV